MAFAMSGYGDRRSGTVAAIRCHDAAGTLSIRRGVRTSRGDTVDADVLRFNRAPRHGH